MRGMRSALALGFAGALLASVAQAQAPQFYAFGDSLVDNGNIPRLTGFKYPPPPYYQFRFSNGPTAAEYLPGLIGVPYVTSHNSGVGGAFAGLGNLSSLLPGLIGTADEIDRFQSAGGSFGPRDTVLLWAGANEYFAALPGIEALPAGQQSPALAQQVSVTSGNILLDTNRLIGLGARQLVVLGVPPLGNTPSFNTNPALQATGNAIAAANNAALLQGLAQSVARTGANIYYINTTTGFNQILANPAHFGLVNTTDQCLTSACVNGSQAQQNQYLFWDGVHPTTGIHRYLAGVIANQLAAPLTLDAQAQTTLLISQRFTAQLETRLDARRAEPGKVSVWLGGGYGFGDRNAASGRDGYDYQLGSVMLGAETLVAPGLIAGAAAGYAPAHARFANGAGTLDYDGYQFGLYASRFAPDWFVNGAVAYTVLDGRTTRPGVLPGDAANGSPGGHAVGASARGGYVLHAGPIGYGPIGGLAYTHGNLRGYTETGADALLTQQVMGSDVDSLIGYAGGRVTTAVAFAGVTVQPRLDLQVEREFLNGARTLQTSFVSAGLPIGTRIAGETSTYERVGVGVAADLTDRLAALVDFTSTFGRRAGDDRAVTARLRARF